MRLTLKLLPLALTLTLTVFGCDSGDGGTANTGGNPDAGSALCSSCAALVQRVRL